MRKAAFLVIFLVLFLGHLDTSLALFLSESERWIVCTEYSIRFRGLKCTEPRKTKVWRDDIQTEWWPLEEICPRDHSLLRYIVEDILLIFQPRKVDFRHYRLFESLEEAQSWCNKNCICER